MQLIKDYIKIFGIVITIIILTIIVAIPLIFGIIHYAIFIAKLFGYK